MRNVRRFDEVSLQIYEARMNEGKPYINAYIVGVNRHSNDLRDILYN